MKKRATYGQSRLAAGLVPRDVVLGDGAPGGVVDAADVVDRVAHVDIVVDVYRR